MKKLTIAVSLRILLLITFGLNLFNIVNSDTQGSLLGPQLYSRISLWLVLLLIFIQQYKYMKSRPDGRIILKELVLPEFNSADEREAELTGKASKAAFATTIAFSLILVLIFSFILIFDVDSTLFSYLAIVSVPIAGLIAYYFSYRYHYLR